jgi:hypothetical protein
MYFVSMQTYKIITFVNLKATIRPSYMFVHTCCYILVFVMCGFHQNEKRIQNSFENCFGNLEKK